MNTNSFDNLKKKNILFISELPENINKTELENFFADYKSDIFTMQIDSNHKRHDNTKRATIIFKEHDKAAEARNNLNMKKLKGKALNIMWHETDNSVRYNNKANLFVKGIPANAQPRQIYELFAKYGEIISCKICENEDGDFLGYGYINYYNLDSANNAIQNLNNTKFLDSNLEVEHFQRKNERLQAPEENCSLYIKNIPEKYKKIEELKKLFSKFGSITFSKMFKDDNNRDYAIIIFSEAGNARKLMRYNSYAVFVEGGVKKEDITQDVMTDIARSLVASGMSENELANLKMFGSGNYVIFLEGRDAPN